MKKGLLKFACDAAVVAGAVICDYGLSLAWHPLGFIVGGLALGAGAFFVGYQKTDFRSGR